MIRPSTSRLLRGLQLPILALVALLAAPEAAVAQPPTPQIAKVNASRSNSTFLLGFYPTASKTQSLYLPSDLTGAMAGNITQLYFMYGSTGITTGTTLSNLTIKLGQTTSTAFSGTNFFPDNILATVRDTASYTIARGTSGDWFSIPLMSSFTYDPTQTLILQITHTGSTSTNFGTYGSTNNGKKMHADTLTATTGSLSSGTWQHFGFDLGAPVGLPEVTSADGELQVFPNSATNTLNVVRPNASSEAVLTLRDALGRSVRQQKVSMAELRHGTTLNVHDLPAGPYVLSVLHCYQEFTRRVNILHP